MMKKIVKYIAFLSLLAAVSSLTSCKPTENNYRKAYDAAKTKREKAQAATDDLLPEGVKLSTYDGSYKVVAPGDTVRYLREFVKSAAEGERHLRYNVAVAMMKMHTNAEALRERLVKEGWPAILLKHGDEKWYVAAGSYSTLEEAVEILHRYEKKNPHFNYIGLEGDSPLLLESLRP